MGVPDRIANFCFTTTNNNNNNMIMKRMFFSRSLQLSMLQKCLIMFANYSGAFVRRICMHNDGYYYRNRTIIQKSPIFVCMEGTLHSAARIKCENILNARECDNLFEKEKNAEIVPSSFEKLPACLHLKILFEKNYA